MARLRPRQTPSFNKAEIQEMEVLHKDFGEETLSQTYCEKLARKFSRAEGRLGKPAIQWEQVQGWFKQKQQACKSEGAHTQKKLVIPSKKHAVAPPSASVSNSEPEPELEPEPGNETEPDAAPKDSMSDEKHTDISELEFEAKSSKDGAWYDVSIFLTHRELSSGEREVRVRFVGFGAEEDEWVNVKTGVRERSLPMESTECHKVNVGDLVLCFQERRDQAIYFDAHILEIQRRLHDIRGCRCLFLVRYDHDNTEEKVLLRRLCRRPSY